MTKRLAAVVFIGLVIGGCASDTPPGLTKDGVAYGATDGPFRGRWWSYYERGSSFLGGEYLAEAQQDLEKALQGRSSDSWRARTYGLHFVEYFPNRELGIVYFKQGNLEQAEEYLNRSLTAVDTDRAHYFLDLVAREKIAKGIITDTADPGLTASLTEGAFLTQRVVDLKVSAEDDQGVYNLRINGEDIHLRGSQQAVAYNQNLVLNEGPQQVQVAATDLADKAITHNVNVTVDLTGPTIGIMEPLNALVTQSETITLRGAAVDKNGISHLALGQEVLYEGGPTPRQEFEKQMPLAAGDNTFIVIARDIAGNETRTAVSVFRGEPTAKQAKLWRLGQLAPEGVKVASAMDTISLDMLLAAAAEGAGGITIKYPSTERPYRHNRTVRVVGDVVSAANVAKININGDAIDPIAGAPKETFNKMIPVEVGANGKATVDIVVHAEDAAGAAYDKTVQVNVEPVPLDAVETKMPVAVIGFDASTIDENTQTAIRTDLYDAFLNQGRFNLLERAQLDAILVEQKLSAEQLTDPQYAIQVGKIMNANIFLIGEVVLNGDTGLQLKGRAVNVESGEMVKQLDVFVDNKTDAAKLKAGCVALADQLKGLFPRISGEVVAAKDKNVYMNWTTDDALVPSTYCVLLKNVPEEADPVTGLVLTEAGFEPIGKARIVKVQPQTTQAEVVENTAEGGSIAQGTPAITW